MKLILTGAAGFIGSCFLWKLNTMGIEDIVLVDASPDGKKSPNLAGKKFLDYHSRDEFLKKLDQGKFNEFDLIVHLGACADTTEKDVEFLKRNNTEYSKHLAIWAMANNKAFHYASSAAIYGDGSKGYGDDDQLVDQYRALNPYGDSKLQFDRWLIRERLSNRVVGYRYFNVFGPNEYHKGDMKSMVCKAFHQIKETGKARLFATTRPGMFDGSEQRDFVYVKDVCEVMAYFVEHPSRHGIFNLGTGEARTFKDLVLAVFSALKVPVNIEFIPMPSTLKGQYQYFTQADVSKLRQAGYSARFPRLEYAIADYVKFHLDQSTQIL